MIICEHGAISVSIWILWNVKCLHTPSRSIFSTNLFKLQADTIKHYNSKLAHINARSITNKSGPIRHYLHDHDVDICAITETWVKTDDQTDPK